MISPHKVQLVPYMPYYFGMGKTSVYLTDDEAEGLRRAAAETGRCQADLLRDGLYWVLMAVEAEQRQFLSLGAGRGGGAPHAPWDPDEVYEAAFGRE